MKTRFKKNAKIFDIVITAVGGTLSVGVMLYAAFQYVLHSLLGNDLDVFLQLTPHHHSAV